MTVTFSQPASPACSVDVNVIQIEFLEQFGALSPLVAEMDATMEQAGGSIRVSADGVTCFDDKDGTVFSSVKGTKEADDCAGRGSCDSDQGFCSCYDTNGDAYFSSDGYGSPGTRGDCGCVTSPCRMLISCALLLLSLS